MQPTFAYPTPLVVAPMAGGPTTPELVATSCEAGALGMLDGAYRSPEALAQAIARVRARTKRPFGINLFISTPMPPLQASQVAQAQKSMLACCQPLGLSEAPLQAPYAEDFESQFTTVLRAKPAVLSITFGLLTAAQREACQSQGIYVIGTATTLAEARALEASGVDAVVAQGAEAGGHRGIFDPTAPEPNLGTAALCAKLKQALRIPFIASGGIMHGQDIATALQAGAQAAQLGTAFLLCPEAGTSAPYREALQAQPPIPTQLTRAYSGRLARGLKNTFMRAMDNQAATILPFPAQNALTRPMRTLSASRNNSDYLSLWAGTGHASIRPMAAGALVLTLLQEASTGA